MPLSVRGKPNEMAPDIMCDNSQDLQSGDLSAYGLGCIHTLKLPIHGSLKE
ncbi:hypothetical protein PUR_34010 [Paenibacillus sp. URB8-2]|nr:hypothetical protein PUR_34010 [Paenibacillus sp. URB8-2]